MRPLHTIRNPGETGRGRQPQPLNRGSASAYGAPNAHGGAACTHLELYRGCTNEREGGRARAGHTDTVRGRGTAVPGGLGRGNTRQHKRFIAFEPGTAQPQGGPPAASTSRQQHPPQAARPAGRRLAALPPPPPERDRRRGPAREKTSHPPPTPLPIGKQHTPATARRTAP